MLFFSENGQEWKRIPNWAGFLILLGYHWYSGILEQRKIALVSMPCESAAAGLVSLGAIIRDLGNPNASDIEGHFASLLQYARQYLEDCSRCNLSTCNPELKRCGYTKRATGRLVLSKNPRRKYMISDRSNLTKKELILYPGNCRTNNIPYNFVNPRFSQKWHIEGYPPAEIADSQGQLQENTYDNIIEGAEILFNNMQRTWSGTCLAGRVTGKEATRKMCSSIRFHNGIKELGLEELLTIQGWAPQHSISRMVFFNTRTGGFDRWAFPPFFVMADGDQAFQRILGKNEFQNSDLVGIFHRVSEREQLEGLGDRVHGLYQWYTEDSEIFAKLPPVPKGINAVVLKRRES